MEEKQSIFSQKPRITLEEGLDIMEQNILSRIANQTILVAETNMLDTKYLKLQYGEQKGPLKVERQAKKIIIPTQYHMLITNNEGKLTKELIKDDIIINVENATNPLYTEIIAGKENAQEYIKQAIKYAKQQSPSS